MAFGASSANILNITYLFAPLGTNKPPLARRFNLVGAEGFEPPTPCSQSRCASQTALCPVPNEDRKHILFNLSVNLHFINKERDLKALPRADTLLSCTLIET